MSNTEFEKKTKLLFILLENPTGMGESEICKIATQDKNDAGEKNPWHIGAKRTVDHLLAEMVKSPSHLIIKDRLGNRGRYTINLISPVRELFSEGGPQLTKQIDKFLKILYANCDTKDKEQREALWKLGNAFLSSEFSKAVLVSIILFHYFIDDKVRELWLHSQGYIFDTIFQKMNETAEKFYGIENFTSTFENSDEMAELISTKLGPLIKEISEADKKTLDLICQSNMPNEVKEKLKNLLIGSKPFAQVIAQEEKTARRIIGALKKAENRT